MSNIILFANPTLLNNSLNKWMILSSLWHDLVIDPIHGKNTQNRSLCQGLFEGNFRGMNVETANNFLAT